MRKLAIFTTLLAFAVIAPAASAKIVVGKSIKGVAIGVSENDVVATLGQPPSATDDGPDQITGQPQRTLNYGSTIVGLIGGIVAYVDTDSKSEKTAKGARVGLTEKQLKKKQSGLKCSGKKAKRYCYKGKLAAGAVVTTFDFNKKGRVDLISIALLVD